MFTNPVAGTNSVKESAIEESIVLLDSVFAIDSIHCGIGYLCSILDTDMASGNVGRRNHDLIRIYRIRYQ